MKIAGAVVCLLLVGLLFGGVSGGSNPSPLQEYPLLQAIPQDVFLVIAERNSGGKKFIEQYMDRISTALIESGFDTDLAEILTAVTAQRGQNHAKAIERIRKKFIGLLNAIDRKDFGKEEFVLAEKMTPPKQLAANLTANITMLSRSSKEGAANNYKALCQIMEALATEVNMVAGAQVLLVEKTSQHGISKTVLNTNDYMRRKGTELPITIALKDDVLLIGLKDTLFNEVLALLTRPDNQKSIVSNPRLKEALTQLPTPEATLTFFNMQSLITPIRHMAGMIITKETGPHDRVLNTDMSMETHDLYRQAMTEFRKRNYENALPLLQKAQSSDPQNTPILFNLACLNAIMGKKDAALGWLDQAVTGGFYAPNKIVCEPELNSIRGEPGFKRALQQATELAIKHSPKDQTINSTNKGEVMRLRLQVHNAYAAKDYTGALALIKQAHTLAPGDSTVKFIVACLHTKLGHLDKGLDYLEQAVTAGFYCPRYITKTSDLKPLHGKKRFLAAVKSAKACAGDLEFKQTLKKSAMARRLVDRVMNAVGILDYSLTVERIVDHSVIRNSLNKLVADARERPIYAIFGGHSQQTDFARFLPQETLSFAISEGINFSKLYSFLLETIQLAGDPGELILHQWQEIQKQLGFDFKKDLTDWIQGDSISITLAAGAGSVTMLKVNDEKIARQKFARVLDLVTKGMRQLIAKNPQLMGMAMLGFRQGKAEHEGLTDFRTIKFAMSPEPIVWGVEKGYLMISSSAAAMARVLATANGKHPNIRSNKRAMSEMLIPTGPFSSLSLTDERNLGQDLEHGLGMAAAMLNTAGSFIPEPKIQPIVQRVGGILGKLALILKQLDFYKSTASLACFSEDLTMKTKTVIHYVPPAKD